MCCTVKITSLITFSITRCKTVFRGRGRLLLRIMYQKPNSACFILCVETWCSETLRTDRVLYSIWVKKKAPPSCSAGVQVLSHMQICANAIIYSHYLCKVDSQAWMCLSTVHWKCLSHTHILTHTFANGSGLNVTKAECAGEIPKCVMCSENPIIYQTHRNTHETSPVLVTDWALGHSGPPSDSKAHSCLSQGSSSLQRFLPNCIIKDKLFLISAFKHAAL